MLVATGCTPSQDKQDKFVFALVDKTDSPRVLTNYEKALAKIQVSLQGGGRVIISPIWETKQKISPWLDETLESESILDNPLERQEKVRVFRKNLERGMSDALHSPYGAEKSAILHTLVKVSEIMASVPADKKVLLILSDMLENSDEVNFYRSRKLRSDPSAVLKDISAKAGIPNLVGVNVYIVTSSGIGDDILAEHVEKFWRLYFGKTGSLLKQYTPYLASDLD